MMPQAEAGYEFALPMPNAGRALFRSVVPEDRDVIQKGIQDLSTQSRYFRFFTSTSSLPDSLLDYLTNLDQNNHVAWIAFAKTKGSNQAVGISRYIRLPDDPKIAELAIVVLDRFQKKGFGTYLMAFLYFMAAKSGVKTLRAIVHVENEIMRNWLAQLGATGKFEIYTYKMDIAVHRDFSLLPATPAAQKLRVALEKIAAKKARRTFGRRPPPLQGEG